jgi:hypothetical protein
MRSRHAVAVTPATRTVTEGDHSDSVPPVVGSPLSVDSSSSRARGSLVEELHRPGELPDKCR